MRDPFNRFALRYLAAVVCGLALLLLHSTAQSGLPAAFVPQCPSPWELSKLAFWPLLAAWVLTGRLGRERRTLLQDLPAAVLTPLAMTAACWGLAAAGGNGAASLAVWAVLHFLRAPGGGEKTAGIELELCGTAVRLRAVLDTGCHLKDPVTCLPVLLVSYPDARSRLPASACRFLDGWFAGQNPDETPEGLTLRLIPCTTAAGRSVLPGFSVRQIGLITSRGVLSLGRTAVAFTRQPFSGTYEALYGSDFL